MFNPYLVEETCDLGYDWPDEVREVREDAHEEKLGNNKFALDLFYPFPVIHHGHYQKRIAQSLDQVAFKFYFYNIVPIFL